MVAVVWLLSTPAQAQPDDSKTVDKPASEAPAPEASQADKPAPEAPTSEAPAPEANADAESSAWQPRALDPADSKALDIEQIEPLPGATAGDPDQWPDTTNKASKTQQNTSADTSSANTSTHPTPATTTKSSTQTLQNPDKRGAQDTTKIQHLRRFRDTDGQGSLQLLDHGSVRLRFGSTLQARLSHLDEGDAADRDQFGIGLRRVRLFLHADLGPWFESFVQFAGDDINPIFLDVDVGLKLGAHWSLHLGRFGGAQPAAYVPTPHMQTDSVERTAIGREWARRTIGADGRDFALELRAIYPSWDLRVQLQNGDGSWDRLRGNQREDVGALNPQGEKRIGKAGSFSLDFRPATTPGFEIGAYAGFNAAGNPNTLLADSQRSYVSWAAHMYYGKNPGSQPVRLKIDLIGIRYEDVDVADAGTLSQTWMGFDWMLAALAHKSTEAFVRVEGIEANDPLADTTVQWFLDLGVSFSLSALRGLPFQRERLTLSWTGRYDNDFALELHQVTIQAQLAI